MSYATVATASIDTALIGRVNLGLLVKAYTRVDSLASGEDQREFQACIRVISGTHPASWVTAILLVLDIQGALLTATDAEINTAVNTAWNRIKLVG